MEIYVITRGEYDDYHIIGATTNEEKAKHFKKLFTDGYNSAKVEVFYSEDVDEVRTDDKPWLCKYDKDTLECLSIEYCAEPEAFKETFYMKDGLAVKVFAKTIEEAAYKSRIIVEEASNGNPAN